MKSQISILIEECGVINLFIYPLFHGNANGEINVTENETEIMMKICNFFNRLSCVKKKAISTIPEICK